MTVEDKSIPESHRFQREEGRRKAFTRAGIPAAMHDTNLLSIRGGDSLVEWLRTEGGDGLLKRAETWLLRTHGADAAAMMPLVARAVLLRNTPVRVIRVTRLIRAIDEKDYDLFDDIRERGVLFLEGFFTTSARPVERPFTSYQRAVIEDLIIDRKHDGHASVLQVVNLSQKAPALAEWWTDNLLSALNTNHQFLPVIK